MAPALERVSVKDRLTALLQGEVVRAALFSTFTFSRNYFERDILEGLLGPNSGGAGLGRFPVTVLMDASQFLGQGRGYDVILSRGRLWHSKAICLMVGTDRPRTILLVGSGNLTPSGWESNLELFLDQTWAGWTLPKAVEDLFASKQLQGRSADFVDWYRRAGDRKVNRRAHGQYISSANGVPIWDQWRWSGHWHEAHVVSPFLDNSIEEGSRADESPTQFFQALESQRDNGGGRLNLYLRDAGNEDGSVVASWKTIQSLAKRFDLHVFRCSQGGPLHAKLFVVRQGTDWYALGGSPNASGSAMIRKGGNVELAWSWEPSTKGDVTTLLPEGRPVAIKKSNFVEPEIIRDKRPWDTVERARYNPKTKTLKIDWRGNHGPHDTELLWGDARVFAGKPIHKPGDDRALQLRPRKVQDRRKVRNGWIPVEWPPLRSDSPELDAEVSFLDLLAMGAAEIREGLPLKSTRQSGTPRSTPRESGGVPDFAWKERVDKLRNALDHIESRLAECALVGQASDQELDYLCTLVARMFESADRECLGLDEKDMERTFREWSKSEIDSWTRRLDRRTRGAKLLRGLSRGWPGRIHELLR